MILVDDKPVPRCTNEKSLYGHRFTQDKILGTWLCHWCGVAREDNDKEINREKVTTTSRRHEPNAWPSEHFRFLPADEFLSRGRGVFPGSMGDE